MSLSLDLAAALLPLTGQTFLPPHTVQVSDGRLTLEVDLLTVERLGVSCEEIRLQVPGLAGASLDVLKRWAQGLCQRITYLLEPLGPLEYDAQGTQVLIRSQPPDQTPQGQRKYYEVLLSALGAGRFSLRRYEAQSGVPGRQPVPLRLTHEQLAKLVNDLVTTLPLP
ncbi:MAG: hypothetical protein KatS3mg113_0450 [Planctomycetaceae bacterium]|nr:MAG: hypothetical protein KatS3mg113_0450 [Planctomycetaceae bacterium]